MKQKLIIIKLGGAAITDKKIDYKLRPDILSNVMQELSLDSDNIILVHGAGSFAHNLAKEYNLLNGIDETIKFEDQKNGICKVRRSLENLHARVLDAAIEAKLSPFTIPISSIFVSKGHLETNSLYLDSLLEAINNGFIPVIYGDISFDTTTKFRVVSGDRIIYLLCKALNQEFEIEVIFGSNVDGLFDSDPTADNAKLIPRIEKSEIDKSIENAGGSAGIDVTGGMKGKLLEIKKISNLGITVHLVNITVPSRLNNIIKGIKTIETVVTP